MSTLIKAKLKKSDGQINIDIVKHVLYARNNQHMQQSKNYQ